MKGSTDDNFQVASGEKVESVRIVDAWCSHDGGLYVRVAPVGKSGIPGKRRLLLLSAGRDPVALPELAQAVATALYKSVQQKEELHRAAEGTYRPGGPDKA